MPLHLERKIVPHSAPHLFAIVKDVAQYSEFLPWITKAQVYDIKDREFLADLSIGYKMISEIYTSRVTYYPCEWVEATCIHGPFEYMRTRWSFCPIDLHSCTVEFSMEYEFSNFILKTLLGSVLTEAASSIMHAFQIRADAFKKNHAYTEI